jgi:hypothetical protein
MNAQHTRQAHVGGVPSAGKILLGGVFVFAFPPGRVKPFEKVTRANAVETFQK